MQVMLGRLVGLPADVGATPAIMCCLEPAAGLTGAAHATNLILMHLLMVSSRHYLKRLWMMRFNTCLGSV